MEPDRNSDKYLYPSEVDKPITRYWYETARFSYKSGGFFVAYQENVNKK